jgi:hypothetical protein
MKTLQIFFLTLMLAGLLVSCGDAETPAAAPDAVEVNDDADAPEAEVDADATDADAPDADAPDADAAAPDATDADAPAEEAKEESHDGHDH